MNKFFLTLLTFVLAFTAQARTITAVRSGSWAATSTWSPVSTPTNGDMVIIPNGTTVSLNTNENNMQASRLDIRVAGILSFVGNGSMLWINSQSVVYVYQHGKIIANANSQRIIIGTTTVLDATNNGTTTITGPSVARSTSSTNNLANSSSPTGFAPYSPSALPVKFIAFSATRRNSEVLVQWATAEEVDALSYEVELSTDGRVWNNVGSVAAAGNSNTEKNYSFSVRSLPAGTIQFRVKQVDIDGKFTYTAIRTVKSVVDGSVQISAVSGKLLAQFGQELKGATIRFMNLNGQVLQEQRLSSAIGQVLVPTNLKGYVLVAITTDNEIAVSRQLVF